MPADSREACERQANTAKEKYYAQLAEYKKTPQYEAYQRYLEEFKAKHSAPPKGEYLAHPRLHRITVVIGAEGKRSKLETETSTSTRSSSHEQVDRLSGRRVSSTQSDPFAMGHYRSESSPPVAPTRLPSAPLYPSKSTSPATHPLSALNSPRMTDQYSPLSASPRSATLQKENSYEFQPSALGRDPRTSDTSLPYPSSTYGQPYQPSSTTPPSASYSSHYQNAPVDLPSRRPFREPTRLPPLTHEDTTLSSESVGTHSNSSYPPPSLLPSIDSQKSMRVLPQPVPHLGPSPTPLDRPLPPTSSPQQQADFRASSSLAALLRAGELARSADDEALEKEGSP